MVAVWELLLWLGSKILDIWALGPLGILWLLIYAPFRTQ